MKHDGRVTLLRTDEIDWIEAADYYARVHAGTKPVLIRETMSLEARLTPRVSAASIGRLS